MWSCHMEGNMKKQALMRRGLIAVSVAAAGARFITEIAPRPGGRRVLELVVDKATGILRAVERPISP